MTRSRWCIALLACCLAVALLPAAVSAHVMATGLAVVTVTDREVSYRLTVVPSEANFIMVVLSGEDQATRMTLDLMRQGIIVRPMGGYQLGEWIRISIGTPAENKRCFEALKQLLHKSHGKQSNY